MYSDKVRELVADLPNRGRLDDATASYRAENPVCGDVTELQLKVDSGRVEDCRFLALGCPAAVASAAALTELVRGKTVARCRQLSVDGLLDYLGGLPAHKRHGAELAVEVLRQALASCE
ncbi:MAG: iron-sulfur cluster assembly scaffold protein [Acidobacteriota bacterium]|jgi:NifU-like protein